MPIAVISDIHANLEALLAVLADIDQRQVTEIVCLGDIVGYGPNPCECLDLVMQRCAWSLMGNHDFAVLYEPTSFNPSAEGATYWTRAQLDSEPDPAKSRARFEYLGSLQIRIKQKGTLWVHASPRRPINEYLFPDDVITAPTKITQVFDRIESRCFVGHTHIPGVFTNEPDFYPPGDLEGIYRFNSHEKCVINPGSVGQPRDRDPRASYGIIHDDHFEFIRVNYDVQAVAQRVKSIPQLADFLGLRLLEGR